LEKNFDVTIKDNEYKVILKEKDSEEDSILEIVAKIWKNDENSCIVEF